MKSRSKRLLLGLFLAAIGSVTVFFAVRAHFRRPYRELVERSGVPPSLVYAVMLAESGFDEDAQSGAGAMGLMQLMPATAEFICARENIVYEQGRLFEGEYNATLGSLYLRYLTQKFPVEATALAAYNAGEGVVSAWLKDGEYSSDGKTLLRIPYPETEKFVKKVLKFRKIYDFFY